jgi:hypothetical protein
MTAIEVVYSALLRRDAKGGVPMVALTATNTTTFSQSQVCDSWPDSLRTRTGDDFRFVLNYRIIVSPAAKARVSFSCDRLSDDSEEPNDRPISFDVGSRRRFFKSISMSVMPHPNTLR